MREWNFVIDWSIKTSNTVIKFGISGSAEYFIESVFSFFFIYIFSLNII